jgi:SNF2 family DNA or RNA helicase
MVKLLPHQKEAMEQTEGLQNIAVYHDMGLGKTFTGSEMMKRFNCKVNLIVCQKSKVADWVGHFKEHYNIQTYDLTVPKEFRTFFGVSQGGKYSYVGVINYELAWRRKDLLLLKDFCLMLDESSLIQNKSAKQTKFILKLHPSHVILLSGTPVGGKYENLWTQLHLMGWDISEKLYEKQYVNWKTIQVGGMVHKIVDKDDPYKNTDRLKRKMREHGAVFKKTEECFQLPEQTFAKVMVKPIKEYWKFQKDSIVTMGGHWTSYVDESGHDQDEFIGGQELIGDTTLTKLLFSRQLCGHFNKGKLEAFRDLVESTQDRLIVFYSFNAELELLKKICHDLGRPTSEINGHCKDLTAYEQESNSVTLCQYQSASKGLNLQKCNRIIYFTLPLSSEDFEQSKKRIHRIGQEKPCFYYLMICKGTVEEQILQTLEARRDFTDELFKERNEEK